MRGMFSSPFLSPSFPFPCFLLLPSFTRFLSLRPIRGLGERCKLPLRGRGAAPTANAFLVYLELRKFVRWLKRCYKAHCCWTKCKNWIKCFFFLDYPWCFKKFYFGCYNIQHNPLIMALVNYWKQLIDLNKMFESKSPSCALIIRHPISHLKTTERFPFKSIQDV